MVWEDLLEKGIPTPVFLPGGFHGQRNLAGYSPYDRKESDKTEQLILALILPVTGSEIKELADLGERTDQGESK